MKTFAERLRYIRSLRQLSQKQLAAACGFSQSAIGNYESALRQEPKAGHLLQLAKVLRVNAEWLLEGSGATFPFTLDTLPTTSSVVHETPHGRLLAPWPFAAIAPDDYWALGTEQRRILEATVASLMGSLQGNT